MMTNYIKVTINMEEKYAGGLTHAGGFYVCSVL